MKFNPDIHNRRSIRLRDYDYRSAGAYFLTICAFQRECLFGEVVEGEMQLNDMGAIVVECWQGIPCHFPNSDLDGFVIMPNHVHGIVVLDDPVGARHASPSSCMHGETRARHASPLRDFPSGPAPRSIGAIVGSFKSAVSKRINTLRDNPGCPVWQRDYYDRVIRNMDELIHARTYIINNPLQWERDKENPTNSA
jgi:REP element-mobilizing transposase RayT